MYLKYDLFFNNDGKYEPVFRKDLDEVQGDKHDAIMFLGAVGPDQQGHPLSWMSAAEKD